MNQPACRIVQGDALEVLRGMESESVDAIVTDPPYFRVKGLDWDRQWDNAEAFLAWIGELCDQWARLLKRNGSLYVFASSQMAARVELEVARRFEVLNHIVWVKTSKGGGGMHAKACKEEQRAWFPQTERVVFAEHRGSDLVAKGEATYHAKCDALRGFLFEPIRSYLASELERSGLTRSDVDLAWRAWKKSRAGGMSGHWFGAVQWALPTLENYEWLRALLNGNTETAPAKEYAFLRKEYEELRKEYEELRRPFALRRGNQTTDVWRFTTVDAYPGKHPCEKPAALLEHILTASTKPGALVLDCFAGSGSTGVACARLGRRSVLVERDPHWCSVALQNVAIVAAVEADDKIHARPHQPDLFQGAAP